MCYKIDRKQSQIIAFITKRFLTPFLSALVILILILSSDASGAAQQETGRNQDRKKDQAKPGIAAKYPGDDGIAKDSQVIFVADFEQSRLAEVAKRWESVKGDEIMSLSDDVPTNSAGQSLLIRYVGGTGTGAHLYRRLDQGYKKLHYRFYVKFDKQCAPIHHFFHVGGYQPGTAWPQGGAGQRPQGNERLTTGVEPFGKHWRWDYYSYWMEMRGSPPRGKAWGNSFINNKDLKVTKGKWQCIELMIKLNDVGKSNGEMSLWIDGKQVSHLGSGFPKGKWVFDKFLPGQGGEGVRWNDEKRDREKLSFPKHGTPFEGFRWRNDDELKLNFVWLLCYITKSPADHVSKIWFDQIVIAEDYIGPIQPRQRSRR